MEEKHKVTVHVLTNGYDGEFRYVYFITILILILKKNCIEERLGVHRSQLGPREEV